MTPLEGQAICQVKSSLFNSCLQWRPDWTIHSMTGNQDTANVGERIFFLGKKPRQSYYCPKEKRILEE